MAQELMSKEQLIQGFADAFEEVIEAAVEAEQRGVTRQGDRWGPRETVAHMIGWEVIASVRIPVIVGGVPPIEFADETQQTTMDNAINAALITLMGEQSLDTLCSMLRQAYQRNVELLKGVEEKFFQPGEYVCERTKGVIEHCQEHLEGIFLSQANFYQEQGKDEQAGTMVQRALQICERALGPEHPHTQEVRERYAALLRK